MLRSAARFVSGRVTRSFYTTSRRGGIPQACVVSKPCASQVVLVPTWQQPGAPGGSLLWSSGRGFAAVAKTPKSDTDLSRAIQAEIDLEKQEYKPIELEPPEPWKVEEKSDSAAIILRRSFGKEDIAVTFVAEPDGFDDEDSEQHHENENEDEDDDEPPQNYMRVPFTVSISKDGDSKPLEFLCVTHGGHDLSIENVNFATKGGDELSYEGPVFTSLDESLQKRFVKYLSARGVNENLTLYIVEALNDKEQREYMKWLKNVQDFVKK